MSDTTIDDILERMVSDGTHYGEIGPEIEAAQERAKSALHDLILKEVVGEIEHIKKCPADSFTCVCPMWQQNKNALRAEQRKKLKELFDE